MEGNSTPSLETKMFGNDITTNIPEIFPTSEVGETEIIPSYQYGRFGKNGFIEIPLMKRRIFPMSSSKKNCPLCLSVIINEHKLSCTTYNIQDLTCISVIGNSDVEGQVLKVDCVVPQTLFLYPKPRSTGGIATSWTVKLMHGETLIDEASIIIGIFCEQRQQKVNLFKRLVIEEYEKYLIGSELISIMRDNPRAVNWIFVRFWLENIWKNNFYKREEMNKKISDNSPKWKKIREIHKIISEQEKDIIHLHQFEHIIEWMFDIEYFLNNIRKISRSFYPDVVCFVSSKEVDTFVYNKECIVRFNSVPGEISLGYRTETNPEIVTMFSFTSAQINYFILLLKSLCDKNYFIWIYRKRKWERVPLQTIYDKLRIDDIYYRPIFTKTPIPISEVDASQVALQLSGISRSRDNTFNEFNDKSGVKRDLFSDIYEIPPQGTFQEAPQRMSEVELKRAKISKTKTILIQEKTQQDFYEIYLDELLTFGELLTQISLVSNIPASRIDGVFKRKKNINVRIVNDKNVSRLEDNEEMFFTLKE